MPGIIVALLIAIAAKFLANNYQVPSMLMAILIGMSLNFLSEEGKCVEGLNFSSKNILYLGIILIGTRIDFENILSINQNVIFLVLFGVILTILFSILILKIFGFQYRFGILIGGAIAICGASAAMAISSVLPKDNKSNERLTFVVLGVTIISTFCMIFYPIISNFLNMDEKSSGIFFGATIHDVAQVVGAGFTVSDITGETATLIKLFRVTLLFPVVLCISLMSYKFKLINDVEKKTPLVPYFIIMFICVVVINSFNLIPNNIKFISNELSSWFLLIAIAAVGTKTRLQNLKIIGFLPIFSMLLITIFLMIFIISFQNFYN
tara:strand:- start:1230 stop:2195 length:966 start_codon:yes stop_codon:yes gene_type:complete